MRDERSRPFIEVSLSPSCVSRHCCQDSQGSSISTMQSSMHCERGTRLHAPRRGTEVEQRKRKLRALLRLLVDELSAPSLRRPATLGLPLQLSMAARPYCVCLVPHCTSNDNLVSSCLTFIWQGRERCRNKSRIAVCARWHFPHLAQLRASKTS